MRVGYQIYAVTKFGKAILAFSPGTEVASYTEAETDDDALVRCYDQFPVPDGWSDHSVKNLETRVITTSCGIPTLRLNFNDEDEDQPVLLLTAGVLPPALPLDD